MGGVVAMAGRAVGFEPRGPWPRATSRRFWEGFTPAELAGQPAGPGLRTVFCADEDWRRAEVEVTQAADTARIVVTGDGDLAAAAARRFLALDVDARGWPGVGRRQPGIRDAQQRLPGLRPAVSIPLTRRRRGRCSPSGCASFKQLGCALS